MLCGCVVRPPRRVPAPPPPPPPPVQTTIYAYPTNGQTAEQQDRDRYDCYQWAIQQTGFDPSSPTVPPHDRVQVVGGPPAVPPGAGVAAGAVTGGVLGALTEQARAMPVPAFWSGRSLAESSAVRPDAGSGRRAVTGERAGRRAAAAAECCYRT